MNYWRIEIWTVPDGTCRLERDLLKKLRKNEKFVYASLKDKMQRYTETPIKDVMYHQELEKVSGETNMWELKFHLFKNEIRFLGCLGLEDETHVYYALYGFKKKEQQIRDNDRFTARGRIEEFIMYNPYGLQRLL